MRKLIDRIRRLFVRKSPSKDTQQFRKWFGDGFAAGITSYTKEDSK